MNREAIHHLTIPSMAKHDSPGKSGSGAQRAKPTASIKKRVLLVDDDVDVQEINRLALRGAGYEVVLAHDRAEAMVAVASETFDLAVLDVIMSKPNDGFELARELRRNPRTAKMPLVMLTSINAVNEAKGLLFRLGDQDRDDLWLPVDKFLDKPLAPEALVRIVGELCG
jgi:CheY-like chemotaxis protein